MRLEYDDAVRRALEYIEEHLKYEIDAAVLASVAGYSEYHFLRVFKKTVGVTPADYIRKRRISEIVRCMTEENRPIADIAFEYGFNSKENFIRAFKREHHILPGEFRGTKNSLKLYNRPKPTEPDFPVTCRIVRLPSFQLIAYKSDEEYPPHFWNRYNTGGWSRILSGGDVVEDFGVSDYHSDTGKMDYYIGIRESEAHGDRTGTLRLSVEEGEYAVFDTPPAVFTEFVNTIQCTWTYIRWWLPEHGYRRTGGYELESYTEQSRMFIERIFIPVQPTGEERNQG